MLEPLDSGSLLARLSRTFGPDRLVTDPCRLEEAAWDALTPGRLHLERGPEFARPLCAVSPLSTEEVQEVVRAANEQRVPLVPYGGGSGLMGGAASVYPGIVVDLRKMAKVVAIDPESRAVRTQAGVVLEGLQRRLEENGFILGHDPWTLPVATVGGAISTNGLGYRGGKYGSIGDQVLGLEAVLPNGEILIARPVMKSSVGIDLKRLLVGTEGCFGIITEATLRIFPCPEKRSLMGFAFPSFEAGFLAVQGIADLSLEPCLLDYGDQGCESERSVLYLGFEGKGELVDAEARLAYSACDRHGGTALSDEEADGFWRDRHRIAYRFMENRSRRRTLGRAGTWNDWIHVALAASRVLAFRRDAMAILSRRGVQCKESGLWTRPELFSMRLSVNGQEQRTALGALEDAVAELLSLAQALGGSMEYCHGVGVKLAPFMGGEHGYGLEVMRRIKGALDPDRIMNPGKLGL